MNTYFSDSYSEGRGKFLKACQRLRLRVESHSHPSLKGPEGEDLAIDCALIGPPDSRKLLVASCGLHGLEAAAGAATMLLWLNEAGPDALPPGVSVLFVHPLNPFGWAYASRGNEDGIDLNRNCIDRSAPPPENGAYAALHDLVAGAGVTRDGLSRFTGEFHDFCRRKGLAYAIHGAAAGQYDFSDGLSYGGAGLSWSCETMYRIADAYLGRAEQVLFIDWHTGIGPYGEPFFISDAPETSAEYARATACWSSNPIHSDDILPDATPGYTGLLTAGLRNELAAAGVKSFLGVCVEWGTYDVDAMLQALVMDNWLRRRRDLAGSPSYEEVRARLVERFTPAADDWRRAVLEKSGRIYAEALACLDGEMK